MSDDDKSTRQPGVFIPFAAAAIVAGMLATFIQVGKGFVDRIAANERVNEVQTEQGKSAMQANAAEIRRLEYEIRRLEAQLEAFKAPGKRFTQEDGRALEEKLNKLSERLAVLEAQKRR